MPLFEYTALTDAGKSVKGMREADSPKTLRANLRKEGQFVTDIKAGAAAKAGSIEHAEQGKAQFFKRRIKTDDLAIMTRQLATLIGAGIPLVEALGALVEQVEHPRLQRILSQVKQRVNEGGSLADALADHATVFNNLYINMIRAGESAGALDIVLTRLADFTESSAKLRSKIVGSLAYPAVMVCVAIIIVGVLFTTVIPKVTAIFSDMDVVLPIYTRVLIAMSDFTRDYWYVVVGFFAAIAAGFRAYLRTEGGRIRSDTIQLKLPVFGSLIRIIAMSRFSRTLSTLLSSGVPLLIALDIVKNILGNKILQEVVDKARESIREGETISAPLKRSGQFPPMVCHMIAVGERTGELESMLSKVADTYDSQVEAKVGALTSLLEPVMIVFMGGGVAFIVAAILMPILQMNTFIKG